MATRTEMFLLQRYINRRANCARNIYCVGQNLYKLTNETSDTIPFQYDSSQQS